MARFAIVFLEDVLCVEQGRMPRVGDVLIIKKEDLIKNPKDPKGIIIKKIFGLSDLIKVKIGDETNSRAPAEENFKAFSASKLSTSIALLVSKIKDFVKIDVHGADIKQGDKFPIGNSDILSPPYKYVLKVLGLQNNQLYEVIVGTSANEKNDPRTRESLPAFNGEIRNIQ